MSRPGSEQSAWSPLRHELFRAFWIASLVSNVGTWMHTTSAAWLMTTFSASPLLVSLMQTAASLPFFLLALPAGALADVVRRRLLLVTQIWMLAAAAALGVATLGGVVTPWVLRWPGRVALVSATVLAIAFFGASGRTFIYFQF